MDRELRLAAFQTWLEEEKETARKRYLECPEDQLEEEVWDFARWNTLDEVFIKLKEALGE